MEQFEKVCEGLEHCKTEDCSGCPYEDTSAPVGKFGTDELVACQPVLFADALALIRQQQERIKELEAAQTARVMTLEELENALDTVVWVEEPGFENFADYYALIMAYSHKEGFVRVHFGFAEMPVTWGYKYKNYGKEWRCWTQRPTDEQRKAVKWNA